jgi:hypothetical protein
VESADLGVRPAIPTGNKTHCANQTSNLLPLGPSKTLASHGCAAGSFDVMLTKPEWRSPECNLAKKPPFAQPLLEKPNLKIGNRHTKPPNRWAQIVGSCVHG